MGVMSEMPDDTRVQRIGELLDQLRSPDLSAEQRAALELELDQFVQVREMDPNLVGVIVGAAPGVLRLLEFAERLRQRQASRPIDFNELRRRKQELDQRLLGGSGEPR